ARPPHDEMIRYIDEHKDQFGVEAICLPGVAPGSSWVHHRPRLPGRESQAAVCTRVEGRATRLGSRPVARGELRRLRGAEDVRPDATPGLEDRSRSDSAADEDRRRSRGE